MLTLRDQWIGRARLAAFALILGTCWLCFGPLQLSPSWLAVPGALFFWLVAYHDRTRRRRDDAGRGAAFYDRGLARLEDRWAGLGAAGERFIDPEHPFSSDLDLFGPASLFELLSLARTRQGEDTLARWLQAGSSLQEIEQRQQAVQEMSGMLDLRERLSRVAGNIPAGVDFDSLADWGKAPVFLDQPWLHWLGLLLALGTVLTLVMWLGDTLPWWPVALFLAGEAAFAFSQRRGVRQVIKPVEKRAAELRLLAGLLYLFEQTPFDSIRLKALQAELQVEGQPPSRRIRGIL